MNNDKKPREWTELLNTKELSSKLVEENVTYRSDDRMNEIVERARKLLEGK